jgi:AAA+ superfamily predicted ATPase
MSRVAAEELHTLVRSGWRLVALETFEEERAWSILEKVATRSERTCMRWSIAGGLAGSGRGEGSLDAGLRAIAEIAAPTLFVFLDAHRLLDHDVALRRLRDMLPTLAARKQTLVMVGPAFDLPPELGRETAVVQLPLPTADELRQLFSKILSQQDGETDAERLEEAVRGAAGLTSIEAARLLRKSIHGRAGVDETAVREIVRDKRRALRRTPALAFHDDATALSDVGGLGELKRWLAERRRAFGDEAREFGLPLPRGLLLLGIQGCGKSISAKAVAREWQFPLLRLDLAAAFGGGRSSPESTLREAIQVAESLAPAVLWIDEIEKGFASTSGDPSASRVFGSFLTWLSEKRSPVFVVATANDVTQLPPELLRRGRFDDLFFVDLPSQNERKEIFAIHLSRHSRDPLQFDLEELALAAERLTGAELEQVVTAALYTAFAEKRDLAHNHLANAIEETVPIYDTYEERIKELRDWARGRARPASVDAKIVDLFAQR